MNAKKLKKPIWILSVPLAALFSVFTLIFTLPIAKASPNPSMTAPSFSLPDENGKLVNLSDFAGKTVVLEWLNPSCPFVKRHGNLGTMKHLAQKYADSEVVWLGVNSTHFMGAADNREWISKHELPYHVLADNQGTVGKAYGAKTTPFMVVIDKESKIAYRGAIDNDPDGELGESAVNYVDQALTALTSGKHVLQAETKSYGCSVKYAS